jgi:hypothetical protein
MDKLADRQYFVKPLRDAAEFRRDWRSARFSRDRHAVITGLSFGSLLATTTARSIGGCNA